MGCTHTSFCVMGEMTAGLGARGGISVEDVAQPPISEILKSREGHGVGLWSFRKIHGHRCSQPKNY